MKAKKSLGQNFFVNQNLAKRIVAEVLSDSVDILVEIGPGQGYFTKLFHEQGKEVLLIEKDDVLARQLQESFTKSKVLNVDLLEWDFEELKSNSEKKITFFGSLPYNVSKKIIERIIQSEYFNNPCFFIIQKEVAENYISKAPQNNFLATKSTLYADSKKIFDITPESFRPRPKVMSSLISFYPKSNSSPFLNELSEKRKLDIFLQQSFKQPRKKLSNNLKNYTFFTDESEKVQKLLERRAQHTSLEEFLFLFSNIRLN